jgi:protein-arginine kinase activator protein McsA
MATPIRALEREQLKERCLNYLGGKVCSRCSARHLSLSSYDFHHQSGDKEANISQMINQNLPFEQIKIELNKCKVLCANCHRETHQFNIKYIYSF